MKVREGGTHAIRARASSEQQVASFLDKERVKGREGQGKEAVDDPNKRHCNHELEGPWQGTNYPVKSFYFQRVDGCRCNLVEDFRECTFPDISCATCQRRQFNCQSATQNATGLVGENMIKECPFFTFMFFTFIRVAFSKLTFGGIFCGIFSAIEFVELLARTYWNSLRFLHCDAIAGCTNHRRQKRVSWCARARPPSCNGCQPDKRQRLYLWPICRITIRNLIALLGSRHHNRQCFL